MAKGWCSFKGQAGGRPAEIVIYDVIGLWGYKAVDFARDLAALGPVDRIDLRVNSPGGDVYDGLAIFNMLSRHPATIVATIDGIAASMASIIVMAADEVVMPANAFMMIHDPSGFEAGTADDLRELAKLLDNMKSSMVGIYAARTGRDAAEIEALMTAETYMTAAEAVEKGFADRLEAAVAAAARFDLDQISRAPAAVRALFAAPPPAPPRPPAPPANQQETTMSDAAAREDAVTAERARIKAILGADQAKGRATLAQTLAMDTALPVEQALTILGAAAQEGAAPPPPADTEPPPPPPPRPPGFLHQAMNQAPNPQVGPDGKPADPEAAAVDAMTAMAVGLLKR